MIQRDMNNLLEMDARLLMLIAQDIDKAVKFASSVYGLDREEATEILNRFIIERSLES